MDNKEIKQKEMIEEANFLIFIFSSILLISIGVKEVLFNEFMYDFCGDVYFLHVISFLCALISYCVISDIFPTIPPNLEPTEEKIKKYLLIREASILFMFLIFIFCFSLTTICDVNINKNKDNYHTIIDNIIAETDSKTFEGIKKSLANNKENTYQTISSNNNIYYKFKDISDGKEIYDIYLVKRYIKFGVRCELSEEGKLVKIENFREHKNI